MRLIEKYGEPDFYIPMWAWRITKLKLKVSGHILACYRWRNHVNAQRLYNMKPFFEGLGLWWSVRKAK